GTIVLRGDDAHSRGLGTYDPRLDGGSLDRRRGSACLVQPTSRFETPTGPVKCYSNHCLLPDTGHQSTFLGNVRYGYHPRQWALLIDTDHRDWLLPGCQLDCV